MQGEIKAYALIWQQLKFNSKEIRETVMIMTDTNGAEGPVLLGTLL